MKIVSKLMLLWLVALLLAGCAATGEGYKYVEKGNDSYLILDADSIIDSSQLSSSDIAPYVSFSSMAEMKSDIKSGHFSEEETASVLRFAKDSKGNIKVCSIENLHEPKVPDFCTIQIDKIVWTGEHYTFWLKARSNFNAELSVRPRNDVASEVETLFTNAKFINDNKKTETYHVTKDIVATVYYFFINTSCKYVHYTFEQDGITYYVQEIHDAHSHLKKVEAIQIWGIGDTVSFSAWITPPTSGPALFEQQWQGLLFSSIADFGVRKYIESDE